jgi:pantoate kinase
MATKKPDIKKMAKRSRRVSRKKGLLDKTWPELVQEIRLEKRKRRNRQFEVDGMRNEP